MDLSVAFQPSTRTTRRGPLIVELAGTPGSGKTTLVPGVGSALAGSGWQTHTPESGARPVAATTPIGKLVVRIPSPRLREILLWRIYLLYRTVGMARFMASHRRGLLDLFLYQRRRPAGSLTRERRVWFWYLRTAGAQEFFRRHGAADEAFIFDEGHTHRVVQLFSSPVDSAPEERISGYIDLAPVPDLLVWVRCPDEICLERVNRRGVWPRLDSLSESELGEFIANAGRAVGYAVAAARARDWDVVEIANDGDRQDPFDQIDMDELVPAPAAASPGRPLYGARLLRPGRLELRLRGAVSRPGLTADDLDAVLDAYGLSRKGRAHNLAFALRSDSVWVDTDGGRVVVRVYREHWPDATVRHEHSVLRHLESEDYPATRLLARTDRETITRVGSRRLALFRFSPGVNLAGSILFPEAGWTGASRLLGVLLARLHRVTADLEPAGAHHLSLERDDPVAARLDAQLETLRQLTASPAEHADAAWLRARAGELEQRLDRLADIVAGSDLETAVIHGDYGFHNVLLRRDGGATVLDFELARRDWRLVDIVETIAPMPIDQAHHLLAGYRAEVGDEPGDWKMLGEMWEYHRLGGALRSWTSYVERGDVSRLTTARARVEEADRIAAGGVGAWL